MGFPLGNSCGLEIGEVIMEMTRAVLYIAGALLVGFGVGALIVWIRMRLRWHRDTAAALMQKDAALMQKERELADLKLRWPQELEAARKQSVNQSRGTLKGQIGEQLAPLLPGFAYAASDARFLGDPIDYVVFHGYSDFRDSQSNPTCDVEVVILDIKRGSSKLSGCQRAVAEAIEAGRVRFEVVRVHDNGEIVTERYASQ
jgi:predicted Holliday junction resolvase-like endonuclease